MSVVARRFAAVLAAPASLLLVASGVFAARGTFNASAALLTASGNSGSATVAAGRRTAALVAGPGFASISSTAVGCAGQNIVVGPSCFAPQVQFTWTENGVGSNPSYVGGAALWGLFECINNGSNHPEAANKEAITSATTTKTFNPTRNGVVQVGPGQFLVPGQPIDLSTVSAPSGFDCPNANYTLRVTFDHYEGLFLTDTSTGAVAVGLPARLP